MLYYLFEILESQFNFPGASLFSYLSFRAAVSVLLSLIISIVFGKKIINYLKRKQIGENIRELGLEGEDKKVGTPTMGGLIIIIGTLIPVILMSNLQNIYVQILIISTLMLGIIGFIDDYIKVFKKDKKGLKGKFKIAGQSLLGVFVALILLSNNDITIVEFDKNLNDDKIEFSKVEETVKPGSLPNWRCRKTITSSKPVIKLSISPGVLDISVNASFRVSKF